MLNEKIIEFMQQGYNLYIKLDKLKLNVVEAHIFKPGDYLHTYQELSPHNRMKELFSDPGMQKVAVSDNSIVYKWADK